MAVVLAGALCASVGASRKFTGNEYLVYEASGFDPAPVVHNLTEFGLSLWILKREHDQDDPDIQGIIDNRETAGADGFILYCEVDDSDPDPDKVRYYLVFEYKGDLDVGGSGTLEVTAVLNPADIGKWIHVAVDLQLSGVGMTSTARIYIAGVQKDSDTDLEFEPMTGDCTLYVGDGPSEGEDNKFRGDVHDVCIVDDCWDSTELADLQDEQASDATEDDVRFLAGLRDWPCADSEGGCTVTINGDPKPKKGMGPTITYSNQMPTVVVIGDTQNNSMTSTEMEALGQFICDYKYTLEVAAAFHVGDWVNSVVTDYQMERALELVEKLREAEIPWACTLGNHDYARRPNQHTRSVEDWAEYIPETMFRLEQEDPPIEYEWYVDHMGKNQHLDGDYAHAFTFELDGVTQLGIALPFALTEAKTFQDEPTDFSLGWALDIAQQYSDDNENYPGLRVWLVTHEFLEYDQQEEETVYADSYFFDFDNDDTYRKEIMPDEAVVDLRGIDDLAFIFCGHHPFYEVKHIVDETEGELPFYAIMVDHQDIYNKIYSGSMLILSVEVNSGQLTHFNAEVYSPLLDEFLGDGTDGNTFDYDLD